jgi:hypothetical protein
MAIDSHIRSSTTTPASAGAVVGVNAAGTSSPALLPKIPPLPTKVSEMSLKGIESAKLSVVARSSDYNGNQNPAIVLPESNDDLPLAVVAAQKASSRKYSPLRF